MSTTPSSSTPPAPTPPPQTDAAATGADGPDPLAKLHRMSTTAGVASQAYVAVNTTAIVAVILGLASALTLLSNLLLFIPVAGIIVSIVAWRQIRDSNGTETGIALAVLGGVLSLLIGGGVAYHAVAEHNRTKADIRDMLAIADKLQADVKAKKYDDAYQLFNAVFRARINPKTFAARWEAYQHPKGLGELEGLKWNGVAPIYESIKGGGERIGYLSVILDFKNSAGGRYTFMYRDAGSGWQLEDLPDMFPMPKAGSQQQ
jgi:hypothetical protein